MVYLQLPVKVDPPSRDRIDRLMKLMDFDKSGIIDKFEFKYIMAMLGENLLGHLFINLVFLASVPLVASSLLHWLDSARQDPEHPIYLYHNRLTHWLEQMKAYANADPQVVRLGQELATLEAEGSHKSRLRRCLMECASKIKQKSSKGCKATLRFLIRKLRALPPSLGASILTVALMNFAAPVHALADLLLPRAMEVQRQMLVRSLRAHNWHAGSFGL
jgi:hypothetical protein